MNGIARWLRSAELPGGGTLLTGCFICLLPFCAAKTAFALDPNLPPGHNFDLTHWYLTLPDSGASQIQANELTAGYTHASWFYTGADGAMVFWCTVTGGTTPNSSYPRSELREQIDPPDNSSNWKAYGTHVLEAQCRVTKVPSTAKVIIGQIHSYTGNAYPLVKLQYNNGLLDALVKDSPNSSSDAHYPFSTVPLGEPIHYQIKVVDGLLIMEVNGTTQSVNIFKTDPAWTNQTFYFKAGSYCQDNSGTASEGSQVEFVALSVTHSNSTSIPQGGLQISTQPVSQTVDVGNTVSFKVTATGPAPLYYQWLLEGVELLDGPSIIGAGSTTLTLSNVHQLQAGAYSVVVSNAQASVSSSTAMLTVKGLLTLAEALDTPNWIWTLSGSTPWSGQTNLSHDGSGAAVSGTIKDGKSTSLQTTVNGPGTVTFRWKVSSETNKDILLLSAGSKELARISGEVDWQLRSFIIGPGSQLLKWTYSKNGSTAKGQDRAWLDEVMFVPLPPPTAPEDLLVSVLSMGQLSLQWTDRSTNESGFAVERSADGLSFTRVAEVGANATAYTNTGLPSEAIFYYRVSATNVAGSSACSRVGVAMTGPFEAARINFQPASAPVHPGYMVDSGQVYGDRGNGLTYGWNKSNASNTKDRNSSRSPDQRYDTFLSAQKTSGSFWELAVPNGLYNVFVVAGDASDAGSLYKINVEGFPVLNGKTTSSNRWLSGMATVRVSDNRLTVSNAPGATNNRICFIDIARREPLMACPENKKVEWGASWDFDAPIGTLDVCSGNNVSITVESTVTNRTGVCGTTLQATRTWQARDACGNSDLCSQTVTVVDTTAPIILCSDTNICDPLAKIAPKVLDEGDAYPDLSCVRGDGAPFDAPFLAGTTAVTCTATDCSSNSVTCTFNVTVGLPFAAGPADQETCEGANVTLSTAVSGPGPFSYSWKFNGVVIPEATNNTVNLTNVGGANAGIYTLEIRGPCNNLTNSASLTVRDCPPAAAASK